MKKKILDIREKSFEELGGLLHEAQGKLQQLRFDLAAGKVKNVREMHVMRKRVARILTIQKEKQ